MAGTTAYPTVLDTVTTLPAAATLSGIELDGDGTDDYLHENVHGVAHEAIVALETKLGTGASTPAANAVMMGTAAGASAWDTTPSISGLVTMTSGFATGAAKSYINESANANMTVGLTINQGANDDMIVSFKSSDVAHGRTTYAETDDWLSILKASGDYGGARFYALADDAALGTVLDFRAIGGTATTTKTTAGRSLIEFSAQEHDGANAGANITADGNVFGVMALVGGSTVTRVLIDEDGDLYSVTAAQTFDDVDDEVALEVYDRLRSGEMTSKEALRAEYGRFAEINEAALIEMGILGAPIGDGGLTNQTQLIRLLTGVARRLGSRLAVAEKRLAALPAA